MPICSACLQKITVSDTNPTTIWGFNPFAYSTLEEMQYAFIGFYNQNCKNSDFYTTFNEEGYTYTQWYVYYLGSNRYQHKKFHTHTMWLFYILSSFSFFKDIIRLGCKEDPRSTSLLHFLKYLNNIRYLQNKMINIFVKHGLSLADENSDGCSGYDYLSQKTMTKQDMEKCSALTKSYKRMEERLDVEIDRLLGEQMKKCELCDDFIEKYQDMLTNKEVIKADEDVVGMIKNITTTRQDCIDVYRSYENSEKSLERHQYVVDIYRMMIE